MNKVLTNNKLTNQSELKYRQLLYFDSGINTHLEFYGCPVLHYNFKDIRSGKNITLGTCFFNEEVSKILPITYYREITDATNDFDIIWVKSNNGVNRVNYSLEELQREYRELIIEGVSPDVVNSFMVEEYSSYFKGR